jgi:hypothetical protein
MSRQTTFAAGDAPAPRNRAERRAAERAQSRGKRRRAAGAALTAGSAALAATAALAGPGALPAGAAPQTFTVSSTADAGADTLRQAILDANANPGDDTIVFSGAAAGPGAVITLTTGELGVTDNLNIVGPGSANLTVSGNDADRVFYLNAPGLVTVSGLTVADGNFGGGGGGGIFSGNGSVVLDGVVLADNQSAGSGAGIEFTGGGSTLTIRNSTITGNTAANEGGGIAVDNAAGLTVDSSQVSYNVADGDGGGILANSVSGSVSITNSVLTHNDADSGGGGAFYSDDVAGSLTFSGLTVTMNEASNGGGGLSWFDTTGSSTVSNSVISGNSSEWGGGLYTNNREAAAITIESSTVSGNQTLDDGAGVYADQFYAGGTLTVRNSTFSGNIAGDDGGAMSVSNFYEGASFSVFNSTITGNQAADNGGAGVIYYVAAMDLVQSTITGNTAANVGGLYFYAEIQAGDARATADGDRGGSDGGAAERKVHGQAIGDGNNNIVGTILAGNGVDVGPSAEVVSDHSIIGSVDPGVTVTDAGGTQFGVDPMLAGLAANGGPTETMALLPASPARNTGPDPEPTFPGSEFDQRGDGFARVVDGRADVGAFEVQAPDAVVITPRFTG